MLGGQAGAGGEGVARARAVSTGSGAATAVAVQAGGAGGAGLNTDNGGAGGSSSLYNGVGGATINGVLNLVQEAVGGTGGSSAEAADTPGGAATSTLSFNDIYNPTGSAIVQNSSVAYGGVGGAGSSGSSGAAGGAGKARLTVTGTGSVYAYSTGRGGAGGSGSTSGAGGIGKAFTAAYGSYVKARADAIGGAGALAGHAKAKTVTTGTSGTFSAYATTAPAAGQLITFAAGRAQGSVDGKQSAVTKVVIDNPALAVTSSGQAVALEELDAASAGDGGRTEHRLGIRRVAGVLRHRRNGRLLRQERRHDVGDGHRHPRSDGGPDPAGLA